MQGSIFGSILTDFLFVIGALVVLSIIAWNLWVHYINMLYLKSIEWIMLEIVPPKDVFKSPQAMELVFNVLYGGAAGNWYEKYWKGELAHWYSLEIVSIEGKIHFFIRFHKKFRKAFEAQLYAQYPQAEIKEVEDYTKRVPDYVPGGPINLFAYNLSLAKDDPYPIKSYVDYGLDRAVGSLKEEERIDPITPLLETMGSIGVGEQIWIQINIRKETKRYEIKKKDGDKVIIEKGKSWKDKAREIIEEIRKKNDTKTEDGKTIQGRLTSGQEAAIKAIERHMNKPGFDTGMRVLYVANKENYNGNTITAFTSMWRQFDSEDLNSFKMTDLTKSPTEPWMDIFKKGPDAMKAGFLSSYKKRSFFYGSFNFKAPWMSFFNTPNTTGKKPFLLSSEELATIYHLPGKVVQTPTFTRIEAQKSEPPTNLPI